MYRSLSKQLYQVIDQHYLTLGQMRCNNIYEPHRLKTWGRQMRAYEGKGECGLTSHLVKQHLTKLSIFPQIDTYINRKSRKVVETLRLATYDHTFLRVTPNIDMEVSGGQSLIIDPTYKQLFLQSWGHTDKFSSPYANYLASLDPVFIGTDQDLLVLMTHLKKHRRFDPLHCQDVWIKDWHSGAKICPDPPS